MYFLLEGDGEEGACGLSDSDRCFLGLENMSIFDEELLWVFSSQLEDSVFGYLLKLGVVVESSCLYQINHSYSNN